MSIKYVRASIKSSRFIIHEPRPLPILSHGNQMTVVILSEFGILLIVRKAKDERCAQKLKHLGSSVAGTLPGKHE